MLITMAILVWAGMLSFWALSFEAYDRLTPALICPDCDSTVYFPEDMGRCRFGLLDSSCSMGEWDESFIDGLTRL